MTPDHDSLVLEHLRLLPSIAYRLGLRPSAVADLEDYLQAGALGLVQAARTHDPARGSFSTFAWACAANAMLAEARVTSWQRRARPRADRDLAPLPETTTEFLADASAEDPAEVTVRVHQQAMVQAAVAELPPVLGAVVRAYWFDGLQQRDIATRLGVTQSRVSQLLRHAYRLLAPTLHQRIADPTPDEAQGAAA